VDWRTKAWLVASSDGVRPHGEDCLGSDGGAGRVVLAARIAEHRPLGSAQDEQELEALKATAWERLTAGQLELDLGLGTGRAGRC